MKTRDNANTTWKKALREIFGGRTEADRTRLFRAVWRSQLDRMAKLAGVVSPDNTDEMIVRFKRDGIPADAIDRLKVAFTAWRQERDKAQRRAAAVARWHPKPAPVKKTLGARRKPRK